MIMYKLSNNPSSIPLRDMLSRDSAGCLNHSENETSFKYDINLIMIVSNYIKLFHNSNNMQYSNQPVSHYIYQLNLNYSL